MPFSGKKAPNFKQPAGRPKGTGHFGEPTKPMRIPLSKLEVVKQLINSESSEIPLYLSKIAAGFPSPADDYIEKRVDLNEHLVPHPASTFLLRVTGDSMVDAGFSDGDTIIVDRSLEASSGKIVVAALNGELTLKRLKKENDKIFLCPENSNYKPIEINEEDDFTIWGVVTYCLHKAE